MLVVGGSDLRRDFEVATLVGVLDRERHHEVGLVEVPLELIAVGHDREVQRAERIGVGKDLVEAEDRGDEPRELGPLVEATDRRVGREEVVGDGAEVVLAEPLLRMVGRERLVGEAEIHGAETTAAVRERRDPARIVDERGQRVGAHEARDLARAGRRHLRPALGHERPVERTRVGDIGDQHGRILRERSAVGSGGVTDLDYLAFDADNHYYEALDAFTRHLDPRLGSRCVQWCEINGRKYHVVGGRVSHAVVNPTFDPIAKAGAMHDYFRGNPDGKQPCEFLREREPIPAEYRNRDARIAKLDEFGLESIWLFPTLGILYEELLGDDVFAITQTFTAFNRWLDDDWGFAYQDRIFAAPYISLSDLDWAIGELEWAAGRGARNIVMRPAAPHTADGQIPVSDPRNDPFWARVQEAGITVVVHAGDSGYSSNGYAHDGFAAGFSGNGGWRPNVKSFHIERAAHDFLITLVFDKLFERFPGVRSRVGRERRRLPARPLQEAHVDRAQDARLLHRGSGRDVPAQHLDQPVLGRRRARGGRAHGRRPRDLRLRLAAHRGHAAPARLRGRAQGLRRRARSARSCATTPAS